MCVSIRAKMLEQLCYMSRRARVTSYQTLVVMSSAIFGTSINWFFSFLSYRWSSREREEWKKIGGKSVSPIWERSQTGCDARSTGAEIEFTGVWHAQGGSVFKQNSGGLQAQLLFKAHRCNYNNARAARLVCVFVRQSSLTALFSQKLSLPGRHWEEKLQLREPFPQTGDVLFKTKAESLLFISVKSGSFYYQLNATKFSQMFCCFAHSTSVLSSWYKYSTNRDRWVFAYIPLHTPSHPPTPQPEHKRIYSTHNYLPFALSSCPSFLDVSLPLFFIHVPGAVF